MKINIVGLHKADVLLSLYNNTTFAGVAFVNQPVLKALNALCKPAEPEAALAEIDGRKQIHDYVFDYVDLGSGSKPLNVNLSGFEFDSTSYDRCHGEGRANQIITGLRNEYAAQLSDAPKDSFASLLALIATTINNNAINEDRNDDDYFYPELESDDDSDESDSDDDNEWHLSDVSNRSQTIAEFKLDNLDFTQRDALEKLQNDGLTVEHFRNWTGTYMDDHTKALTYLIRQGGMTIDAAVAEIKGLDYGEAMGIAHGLSRRDVLGLNAAAIYAFLDLRDNGLTLQHLRSWKSPGRHSFQLEHGKALKSLIQQRKMAPEQAILEINELDLCQANAIARGLSRDEVIGLTSEHTYALTVLELKKDGLTAKHLRAAKIERFHYYHGDALVYLIRTCHMTPVAALTELEGLSYIQAHGIAKGLSRKEMLTLGNESDTWKIYALIELRSYGLTAKQLCAANIKHFESNHGDALKYLLENKHITPKAALAELAGLDLIQAGGIAKGLSRKDMLALGEDADKIFALRELHQDGLTAAHLLNFKGFFMDDHRDTLAELIRKRHMTPEAAIKEINGLDFQQANRIKQGETRSQVVGLDESKVNHDQMSKPLPSLNLYHGAFFNQGPRPAYPHLLVMHGVPEKKTSSPKVLDILTNSIKDDGIRSQVARSFCQWAGYHNRQFSIPDMQKIKRLCNQPQSEQAIHLKSF